MHLIGDAYADFYTDFVDGIAPNQNRIDEFINNSLMLVTALNTKIAIASG